MLFATKKFNSSQRMMNTLVTSQLLFDSKEPKITEAAKPLRSQGQQTPFSPLSPKKFLHNKAQEAYEVPEITTTSTDEDKPALYSPLHSNCRRIFFEERYSQGHVSNNLTLQIEPHVKHATPNSPSCPPPGAKAPQCTPICDQDHITFTSQAKKSFESELENLQEIVRSKESNHHGSTEHISYHVYSPSKTTPIFHVNGEVHVHSHPLPSLTRYLNPRESEELQKQFYHSKFCTQMSHF